MGRFEWRVVVLFLGVWEESEGAPYPQCEQGGLKG